MSTSVASIAPFIPPFTGFAYHPHQAEGIQWMLNREREGAPMVRGGILADEMGLGKTVQALIWLSMEREKVEARKLPALIVCPTSLVENWAEESKKFTPSLRVLTLSGPDRHERRAARDHHYGVRRVQHRRPHHRGLGSGGPQRLPGPHLL